MGSCMREDTGRELNGERGGMGPRIREDTGRGSGSRPPPSRGQGLRDDEGLRHHRTGQQEDGSPHARGHGGGLLVSVFAACYCAFSLAGGGEVEDLYMKVPCVYMLASKPRGTLYVGATSDLVQRVWQHKGNLVEGFTRQ